MKTVEVESEILVKAVEREVLVALKRFAKVVDASSPVSVYMRCDRNKMDCMPSTEVPCGWSHTIFGRDKCGMPHGRGVNSLTCNPLPPTQHRILTGQLTIRHGTDKTTNKISNNLALKAYPSSGLPAILPAPPSPLHHFLAALGRRSQ